MRSFLFGSLLLLAAAPANAQGVFDMGALTNTLSQPNGAAPAAPAAARIPETAFRFKPSPEVRKQLLAKLVEQTKATNPQGGAELEKLFASQDIFAQVGKGLATYGLRTDDMADAFSVYWVNVWAASRGRTEDGSKEMAQAVRRQAVNAMSATQQIATLTDAQKQEFAEALLLQAMMMEAAVRGAQNNPAQLEQIKSGARTAAKSMGLDLDLIELTPAGFVKAGGAAPAPTPAP